MRPRENHSLCSETLYLSVNTSDYFSIFACQVQNYSIVQHLLFKILCSSSNIGIFLHIFVDIFEIKFELKHTIFKIQIRRDMLRALGLLGTQKWQCFSH